MFLANGRIKFKLFIGAIVLLVSLAPTSEAVALTATSPKQTSDAEAAQSSQARLLLSRGQTLYELGRYSDALSAADEVLASQPDNVAAWELRGNALQQLNQHEEALDAYDQAIALLEAQPPEVRSENYMEISELWAERARILASLERDEESIAAYDRAIQLRCEHQLQTGDPLPEVCEDYAESESTADRNPELRSEPDSDRDAAESETLW
ncbi:MAG: tetratricopeptide repeat protein [Cyanobacteria bacterium CRU_2_1]|nr:tetratricopeptide repeat protein [Cyanobacteria bacterium RU_5_0]NJR62334.1 tetratricopeptide repeat protein [Cyanobacteria bacterium CRU_2_1]